MGEVMTAKADPTTEPLVTLLLEERHAEVVLKDLISQYGTKAEELYEVAGPDVSREALEEVRAARQQMLDLETVVRQTGLWEGEPPTVWPRPLTASRDWLIRELQERLETDSDMVLNSTDRSFAAKRHYMAAVGSLMELLEQLGVEEAR